MEAGIEKEETSKSIEEKKEKIKNWLKDPYNLALAAIIIFAFIVRLYFFFLTKNQALWYDEAEYMLKAKNIAFGTPDTGWWFGRPILFPLIASIFLRLGIGEIGLRFLWVLISFSGVFLIYLIGKELFSRKAGLISAFLASLFYIDLFYTSRLLVDIPQVFFVLLAGYFFIKGYLKNENKIYAWLIIPTILVGVLIRFTAGLFFIILIIFLLVTEKLKFFKEKSLWMSVFFGFLLYIPYWIWSYIKYKSLNPFYVIFFTLGTTQVNRAPGDTPFNVFMKYIVYLPNYTNFILYLIFLAGLALIFFSIILGFDILIKNRDAGIRNKFLIFLWAIIPLVYFGFFVNHFEDRYIFMAFPAIFVITGFALEKIFLLAKKYNMTIALLIVIAVLAFGGYQMLSHSNAIIKDKILSYKDLRETGYWLKQNSAPDDKVLSPAVTELTYYSERSVYGPEGNLTSGMEQINKKNIKHIVITNWENTPEWLFNYLIGNQTEFKSVYQSATDYNGQKLFAVVFSRA